MSFWTAVVIIVLIGAVASVFKARYNAMHGITEDSEGNQTFHSRPEVDEAAHAEIAELRERIKVLERIATDENSSEARKAQRIAREIESLRGDIARRSSKTVDSKTTEDLSE